MKLWILEPREDVVDMDDETINPWEPWFDKAFGLIVRAVTEEDARALAAKHGGEEVRYDYYGVSKELQGKPRPINPWMDPAKSMCSELTTAGEPGLVMSDIREA